MTKKNQILSEVFDHGQKIVETVYKIEERETFLAVFEGGEGNVKESVPGFRDEEYFALPPETDFIKSELLKLPSSIIPYEGPIELYQRIKDFIAEYSQLDDEFIVVSSVYVMMTWVYDRFRTVPYLRVIGLPGTGKSRYLEVLANISYKGLYCGGSTSTSAMFRLVDATRGTLVFDEADFSRSDPSSDIAKILNGGHSKGGVATRSEKKGRDGNFTPRSFSVFGPKIFATRGRFADAALESRCITRSLFPLPKSNRPIHLPIDFENKALNLRNQLLSFRGDCFTKTLEDPKTVEGLDNPRLAQISLALTSVAKMIGSDVCQQVVEFLKTYEAVVSDEQGPIEESDVLVCVGELLSEPEIEKSKKLHMETIARYYNETKSEDRDSNYPKDKLTGKKVGQVAGGLNLRKKRDGRGFYLPLDDGQLRTINLLLQRFGLSEVVKKVEKTEKIEEDDEIEF